MERALCALVSPLTTKPFRAALWRVKSRIFGQSYLSLSEKSISRALIPVDGSLTGQSGAAGCLSIKQRPSASYATQAELTGEISFRDMVRVNGHVAGVIYSRTGTLIVDANAIIEGDVDVATAVVSGIVRGDIVARERVELGPVSKIYGNIFTPSLVIKDGAIFEGVCRMIDEVQKAS
jgi:cytoskeletal protein CcmA (bactofilin family)